jgi:SAM-dependent methyltransferase
MKTSKGSALGEFAYGGQRILEAMRSAPRYTDVVYARTKAACLNRQRPILEFGAGDGAFVERFLQDGMMVECVEPDAYNQAVLRRLGVRVVDSLNEVAAAQFEFVYTINVLEHLAELDHYLAELHRVLCPNGRLFVFVPAFTILWTSLDDEVGHVQRFTLASLTDCLKRTGFKVEVSQYFDSLGFLAALGVRLLEKAAMFKYSPATVGFYDKHIFPLSLAFDRALSPIAGKNIIAVGLKV